MKRLSLICLLSACAALAGACSNGGAGNTSTGTGGAGAGAGGGAAGDAGSGSGGQGTGGAGGAAGSGGAGRTGAGGSGSGGAGGHGAGGASGAGGSSCPGAPALSGSQCRSATDCPRGGAGYYCTTDPAGVSSACATPLCAGPVNHDCTVDTDCSTGNHCIATLVKCCNQTSMTCHVVCNTTTVICAAGTICSPGTTGADDYGCAPQPCNAGYACPTGFECAVGSASVDPHGCRALPCSQTGCPANFVCTTTATIGGCAPKPCATDCDCDTGFCVERTCASTLGTCVMPPS